MKKLKNPKALFLDYSQTIDDVYENFKKDFNPTKKRRVSIVFNVMVADMEPNKKLSTFATEENSILQLFLYHNLISK